MGDTATIDIEKARELVANTVLWPRIRDFLWDFAPQIHESWLDGSVVKWLGSIHQPPHRPSWRIKKFILDSLGVEPLFHDFPKDDNSRLLLLDGATIVEITKWIGALALAGELRKVTSGASVRALKAALPGVYPEVFGYTAYFPENAFQRRDAKTLGAQGTEELVVSTGYGILVSTLAGLPAPLVSRLKFKLPQNLCASAPLRLEEKPAQKVFSSIYKLLKLKFPEAYSICCS